MVIWPVTRLRSAMGVVERTLRALDAHGEQTRSSTGSTCLYAEHSFNASTFIARVVTSALSDIYSAVTAAIGALQGPLHGGANEAVIQMMLDIDDPDQAAGRGTPWTFRPGTYC